MFLGESKTEERINSEFNKNIFCFGLGNLKFHLAAIKRYAKKRETKSLSENALLAKWCQEVVLDLQLTIRYSSFGEQKVFL